MTKFEICVRGENFLIKRTGGTLKNGFYAARFIEAVDTATAVEMAMDSFKEELREMVLNDESDPPMMKVVDVRDVYYFEENMVFGDTELPGRGYLWDE